MSKYCVRFQRGKLHDVSAMCWTDGCEFSADRGVDGGEKVAVATRAKRHVAETGHEVTVHTERAIYYMPSDERVPESEECKRFRHDEHCAHWTD